MNFFRSRLRPFTKRSTLSSIAGLLTATAVLAAPGIAHAEKLLVLARATEGDAIANAAGGAAQALLQTAGYQVDLIQDVFVAVPDDVATYSQVYVISLRALPDPQLAKLVTYVKGGGRLFLTGERPDPDNDPNNLAVQDKILKPLLNDNQSIVVGTGARGGGAGTYDTIDFTADKAGISSTPNTLDTGLVGDPGVVAGLDGNNAFATDADGNVIGAVFTNDELVEGSGCMMLLMDLNFWDLPQEGAPETNAELAPIVENFHDFLKYCGDHDLDGITDVVEGTLGTDPNNPDSDGDGLCDGAIAVNDPDIAVTCIAGENAKDHQDTNGNGTIDALDPDDDGDGIPTATELADVGTFGNPDGDNVPAWLDTDSDGDGVSDADEGTVDMNSNGIPDYLDPDYPVVTGGVTSSVAGSGSTAAGGPSASSGGVGGGGSDDTTSDGCGCSIPTSSDGPSAALLLGSVAAGLTAMRRTRRRSRRPVP